MMGSSSIRCLDPCTKEILYSVENEGGMINSIDLDSQERQRHLMGGVNERFERRIYRGISTCRASPYRQRISARLRQVVNSV